MADRRVVVTGLGVLAPNGHGLEAFERALRQGESGIRVVPGLAELKFGCQVGGVQGDYLSDEELYAMNPNMVYAAIAAIDAWTDAGLPRIAPDAEPDWSTGAVIGTGIGGIDTIAEKLAPKTDAGILPNLSHFGAAAGRPDYPTNLGFML